MTMSGTAGKVIGTGLRVLLIGGLVIAADRAAAVIISKIAGAINK